MSDLTKYIEFVRKWEGSHGRSTNDPASAYPCPTPFQGKTGWHTSSGVTYRVWVAEFGTQMDEQFFAMPENMWWRIFKKRFFDKVKGDSFTNFGVAVFVTDVAWMSGPQTAGKMLQRACNDLGAKLTVDGDIGNKTVAAANALNPGELFDTMYIRRSNFYREIAVGKKSIYLKGWMNRLNDLRTKFK